MALRGPGYEVERRVRALAALATLGFAGAGAAFFLMPDVVLSVLGWFGSWLGKFAPLPETGARFWLALSAAYMACVTAMAAAVTWDPARHRGALVFLAVGKATSSLTTLWLYCVDRPAFVYGLNFVVDGSIAALCLGCYGALLHSAFARGEDPFPGAADPYTQVEDRVLLAEVIDALVTREGIPDAPAPGALVDPFAEFLRGQHPAGPRLFAWACQLVDWLPPLMRVAPGRFRHLDRARRVATLERAAASALPPLRQLVANLRFLVLTVVWSQGDYLAAAGYDGPAPMEGPPS